MRGPGRRANWPRRSVYPSTMSLLGLVRYLAETERRHGHADLLRERIDGRVGQ